MSELAFNPSSSGSSAAQWDPSKYMPALAQFVEIHRQREVGRTARKLNSAQVAMQLDSGGFTGDNLVGVSGNLAKFIAPVLGGVLIVGVAAAIWPRRGRK